MIVKLLTEHHLEFLSLKGGCIDPSESTTVKMSIVGNLMHWLICDKYQICLVSDSLRECQHDPPPMYAH